jgi:starch phosphorylase
MKEPFEMSALSNWKHFAAEPRIAYFSMEIGLSNDNPTYSGGLGILAGDTIKSAADLKLPLVAVTLASRKGYFRQKLDSQGWQQEFPVLWKIDQNPRHHREAGRQDSGLALPGEKSHRR